MTAPLLTIGVPCYNGARELLPWCLAGIRTRSGDPSRYDLVVVDDSGKPDHRAETRRVAEHFKARWLYHEQNRGITAGWNTLSRSSDSPNIILFNDDIIASLEWVDAFLYFLHENPKAGAVGIGFHFIAQEDLPTLITSPSATVTPRHHLTKAHLPREEYEWRGSERPGRVMCPPGCAFGFTREKFELVGGFDESMRQFYNESDLGTSLAAQGFPSYVLPHPIFWHIWSATFQRAPELLTDDPMTKDRHRYTEKWGGDFDVTDPKFMTRFKDQPTEVRWLSLDGPRSEVY